jgi:uncharacterized protein
MAEDLAQGHAAEPEEGVGRLAKGWYPDPFGRFRFRHFDGESWTAYVTDGGDTSWDPEPVAPASTHQPGLPGVGIAVIGFAVGVALSFAVQQVTHYSRPTELAVSSAALWSGLLGAVVFVSARRGTRSLVRDYGLRFRWSDIGFGLAGSLVGRLMAGIAVSPLPLARERSDDGDRSIFDGTTTTRTAWIILVVVVCVGAPLVEELFFRGLLQSRLVSRHGPVVGIVIASTLFGAAHLIAWSGPLSLAYAWAIAVGGLALAATYHYSGRLGASILAHAMFNLQAVIAVALLR